MEHRTTSKVKLGAAAVALIALFVSVWYGSEQYRKAEEERAALDARRNDADHEFCVFFNREVVDRIGKKQPEACMAICSTERILANYDALIYIPNDTLADAMPFVESVANGISKKTFSGLSWKLLIYDGFASKEDGYPGLILENGVSSPANIETEMLRRRR